MDATPRWMQIMQRAPDDIPLDEAALLIAAHANPALDVAEELARLDRIATQVDHPDTGALCRTLFHEMGLSGDRQNYDDPRNSYLDQVLARRRGIPISLSVLLLEIGRRCGLRLEGVGMPGHFLVRDPDRPELLIDAFDQGRRLGPAECERLFQSITGTGSPLTQAMLATTDRRGILTRMLLNLDRAFERRADTTALSWVSTLRLGIPDLPAADRLQLAGRLGGIGRFDEAADLLDGLAGDPAAADLRSRLRSDAASLRARLN